MNDQKNKQKPQQDDPAKMPHNTARKANMGPDVENPDQNDQPGKKVTIDDDPDQTKKKVPNMHK